jgi:hypothetical protein
MRELDEVSRVVPLSEAEKAIVASWSSPETWQPGARHPGRGKYLIKTGQRVGIPVELEYVADEAKLYETDTQATNLSGSTARSVTPVPRAEAHRPGGTGWPE